MVRKNEIMPAQDFSQTGIFGAVLFSYTFVQYEGLSTPRRFSACPSLSVILAEQVTTIGKDALAEMVARKINEMRDDGCLLQT